MLMTLKKNNGCLIFSMKFSLFFVLPFLGNFLYLDSKQKAHDFHPTAGFKSLKKGACRKGR